MISMYFYNNLIKLEEVLEDMVKEDDKNNEFSLLKSFALVIFFFCCLYTASYLPYGKFFNKIGGNCVSLWSFLIIILAFSSNYY